SSQKFSWRPSLMGPPRSLRLVHLRPSRRRTRSRSFRFALRPEVVMPPPAVPSAQHRVNHSREQGAWVGEPKESVRSTAMGQEHCGNLPDPAGSNPSKRVSRLSVLPPIPNACPGFPGFEHRFALHKRIAPNCRQRSPCAYGQLERAVHPWVQVDHSKVPIRSLDQLELEDALPAEMIEQRTGIRTKFGGNRQRQGARDVPRLWRPSALVTAVSGRHESLVGDHTTERVNRAPQALLYQH